MARRSYWIGSLGPYFYDDEEVLPGETELQGPVVYEKAGEVDLRHLEDLLNPTDLLAYLSDNDPADLAAIAAPGTSQEFSRSDHIHPVPSGLSKDVDGGSASSVYLEAQSIDGGGA